MPYRRATRNQAEMGSPHPCKRSGWQARLVGSHSKKGTWQKNRSSHSCSPGALEEVRHRTTNAAVGYASERLQDLGAHLSRSTWVHHTCGPDTTKAHNDRASGTFLHFSLAMRAAIGVSFIASSLSASSAPGRKLVQFQEDQSPVAS